VTPHDIRAAVAARAVTFGALWLVMLPSVKPGDLAMGVAATVAATWASVHLLPPAQGSVRVLALAAQVPRLLRESFVAGVDVARRAFARELPLRTGFVTYPTGMRRGAPRNAFTTITGLLPGTVPAEDTPTAVVYHVLDRAQPVVDELAAEERRLGKLLQRDPPHE
jgi:multicomponent Na+:H+ antiporter subunit E